MGSGNCWIDVAQKEKPADHRVDMFITGVRKFLLNYNINMQNTIKYQLLP